MDALAILSLVASIIQTTTKFAPIVFQGIEDAKPFAMGLIQQITGKAPSAEDEAAIDEMLASLTARLEKPLPPAQPGDPDYVKN